MLLPLTTAFMASRAPPRLTVMKVKTVSETLRSFEALYPRPIVTVWRGPIVDMLQVTHLSIVDQRFKYDPIFGYGYMWIFNMLLEKYPVDGEKDKLIDATIEALDLEPKTVRRDEEEVLQWLEGKSEADILGTGNDKIYKALADIKARDYLHTRSGNVGFISIMETVGVKPDNTTLTRWTDALGLRKRSLDRDVVLLKEVKEKMNQAMQMIKSLEIRDKKRLADQLEKKAQEAQDLAAAKAKEAPSTDPTPKDPAVA